MSENLLNIVRREIDRAMKRYAFPKIGVVQDVDMSGARQAVRVLLLPEMKPTGFIPVAGDHVAINGGDIAPFVGGELVKVDFLEGDIDSGVVCGRLFTDGMPSPQGALGAERWIVVGTSFLKLLANGKVQINGAVEIDATSPQITITATTQVTVDAPSIVLAGGGPAVARVGDEVTCPAGTGHITTGSGKVQSG